MRVYLYYEGLKNVAVAKGVLRELKEGAMEILLATMSVLFELTMSALRELRERILERVKWCQVRGGCRFM